MSAEVREHLASALDSAVGTDDAIFATLVFTSTIEIIAAAVTCDDHRNCSGFYGYAIAVGCISFIVALAFLIANRIGHEETLNPFKQYVGIFLMSWWAIGAGILTFKKPFLYVGNGYLACWVSFALAVALYRRASLHLVPKTLGGTSEGLPFNNPFGPTSSATINNPVADGHMAGPEDVQQNQDARFSLQPEPYNNTMAAPGTHQAPANAGPATVGHTTVEL